MLNVFVSKCLRQLIEIGCILYVPSPNPALKSKVYLILKICPKRTELVLERNPEAGC